MSVTKIGRIFQDVVVIAGYDSEGNITPLSVSDSGGIVVTVGPGSLATIIDFGAPVNVGVLTALFGLTPPGAAYHTLLFCVNAKNATKDINVFINVSSNGVDIEPDLVQTFTVKAGQANSLEIGPFPSRPYWEMSAQSSDGSSQPVTFAWKAAS